MPENGIVIEQATDDGSDLRIPWKEIQYMEKAYGTRLLLKLVNDIEIIMTPPHTGGLFPYRFTDEFVEHVNERAAGQVKEGW